MDPTKNNWYANKDGTKTENVPWQERRNVAEWRHNEKNEQYPVPFPCEVCGLAFANYGDEDALHCTPCWVSKKEA